MVQPKQIYSIPQLEELVQKHGVVLIDFFAHWCGPCARIGPYVQKKTKQNNIALAKVNVDEAEQVATLFQVSTMPTFCVIKDKITNVTLSKVGGSQAVVNEMIENALKNKK